MFSRTTAINKILALSKRKKIIQGGTWAGKTAGIIAILIHIAASEPNQDTTVVAESIPALKKGAMKDFLWIMQDTGRFFHDRWNATDRIYRFANGSSIQFDSFDSVSKAKTAGKRTRLFINEANHIPFPIADALIMRTSGDVWIDFNPDNEFWVHKELVGNEDVDFIILKYTDNQACPESIIKELDDKRKKAATSKYWENWCRVYIDGEIGSLEGVVFQNWEIIDKIPDGARRVGYGLDFGYMNDPSALVEGHEFNGERIFDEVIYQTGLVNTELATLMKANGVPYHVIGLADSAEPKSIGEIKRYGFNIKATEKGKDSILFGINVLQQVPFKVTSRSVNLINELRKYRWDIDKNGNTLNVPVDAFNHAIDAMRYLAQEKWGKPAKEFRIYT